MGYQQIVDRLSRVLGQLIHSLEIFLPNFLGALVIFFTGILLAYLLRFLIRRLINSLNRFMPVQQIQTSLRRLGMKRPVADLIGSIVFWIIILFFVTATTETLGLPVLTTWLSGIVLYLPRILAAVLICLAGLGAGNLIRNFLTTAAISAGIAYGDIWARLIQVAVIVVSVLIAIEHIGINISLLTNFIMVFIGVGLFGAALAFGIGARTVISNILASHYLQKTYRVGHRVQIDDASGRIVQITPTACCRRARRW